MDEQQRPEKTVEELSVLELETLTPLEIVRELDKYVIGQGDAKRAVAIALRNRWRRRKVLPPLQDEIMPKNILMIGPTGVGKTEIARRLAKLAKAPFIKVEATKFTEIGYVGRDVDSIIRDLLDMAIIQVREEMRKLVEAKAVIKAEERVLDALVGAGASPDTREKFRKMLHDGVLDDREIEIQIMDNSNNMMSTFDIPGAPGSQMGVFNLGDVLGKAMGNERTKTRRVTVEESFEILMAEESDKLIDEEQIIKIAINRTENDGIVFLDEIDKITGREDRKASEVNREGVQRDLLPLVEGTTVTTKYGPVKSDHILFIASGAFHMAKPSDLLPELQGRFPIRVELKALTEEDLVRILEEPEASLIKQYEALLLTEGVRLEYRKEALLEIAKLATDVNRAVENIGARRLHTIMEKLLEDLSFGADQRHGEHVIIDQPYVQEKLKGLAQNMDLSKFIL
ncbi:MAG: ATP-dependent protease ATPase subunit HslU [Alphaproteobacteria bacterium]|nr:ATP-dependent protease ATPase subunit HslU [Alphaproteobacteria bacterium]